jgi:hypothetical protein
MIAVDTTHSAAVLEKTTGTLMLKSKPAGADIFLNEKNVGETDWQIELQLGAYAITDPIRTYLIYL